MFAFGPITRTVPAGSPVFVRNVYTALAESGTYIFTGGDAELFRQRSLLGEAGLYIFDASGTSIGRHFKQALESGTYQLLGGEDTLWHSVYHTGDPEMIRVPAEVRSMHLSPENRDMVVKGDAEPGLVTEDHDDRLPPRLRRT